MPTLDQIDDPIIRDMVASALEEDAVWRSTEHTTHGFDAEGFSNFFPEHTAEQIEDAWYWYRQLRQR